VSHVNKPKCGKLRQLPAPTTIATQNNCDGVLTADGRVPDDRFSKSQHPHHSVNPTAVASFLHNSVSIRALLPTIAASSTMRLMVALLSLVLFCQAVTPGHGTLAACSQSHLACLLGGRMLMCCLIPWTQVLLLLHEGICCEPPPPPQWKLLHPGRWMAALLVCDSILQAQHPWWGHWATVC
jgi:hypothetical protein